MITLLTPGALAPYRLVTENSRPGRAAPRSAGRQEERYRHGMTSRKLLADDEVGRRLADLPGWTRDGDAISKSFEHSYDGCAHVAAKAREVDHHPDIAITWRRITFTLPTHSAGGLTEYDFVMAAAIDEIAAALGATALS